MSRFECDTCGLAAMDLPDGVDPEFIFERGDDGVMRCQGCQSLHTEPLADWERDLVSGDFDAAEFDRKYLNSPADTPEAHRG